MLVLIGYLGCDIVLVLVVWFVAVTLITAAYAGAMANIVDIAPNFAGKWLIKYCERYLLNYLLLRGSLLLGPILAFAQTIHMSASFLSPIVAGLLTQESVSKNFVIFYSIELYSSFIRICFPFDRYLSFNKFLIFSAQWTRCSMVVLKTNEKIQFTASPRRMEASVWGDSLRRVRYVHRLSNLRYGRCPAVELSWSKISSIGTRRLSAFERITAKERKNCHISVQYVRRSVTQSISLVERRKKKRTGYVTTITSIFPWISRKRQSKIMYTYIYV